MSAISTDPQPISDGLGATILGPRNVDIEQQNPDGLIAPTTDAGTVPNLKFSYAAAHNRVLSGGWAREITTRELPIATELAGVNMRLTPGGIRELHWHKEAEWAYMIAGECRVSVLDEEGRLFIDDVGVGDLWYFPAGLPHSIQALENGAEFLLVFDSGDFSENETFLITDWFNHTPGDALAKNFGVSGRRLRTCRSTSLTRENTGEETLTFLEMFRSDHFADVSLSQWMGVLPPELVKAHLSFDDAVIAALPRTKPIAVRWAS